jgi:hypothetical protein
VLSSIAGRYGQGSEKIIESVSGPGESKSLQTDSSYWNRSSETRGANNAGWYETFGWSKSKTDSTHTWSGQNSSGSVTLVSESRTNNDTKADLAANGKKFWHKYNVSSFAESTKTTVNNGVTPGPDFTPIPMTMTEVVYKLRTEDSAALGSASRTYRLSDLSRTTTTMSGYMFSTWTVETKLDYTSTLALDAGSEIGDSPFRETFEILAGFWEGALQGLDNIASFAESVIASVAEGAAAAWADFVIIAKNPGTFLWELFVVAIPATFADGRAFDSLAGATVSAVEGTLGLPAGTIPASAPFGHDETFANGRMVGDYWAMANQGAFLASGLGLVGAAKCGSFASKALHTLNGVQDSVAVGIGAALAGMAMSGPKIVVRHALKQGLRDGAEMRDRVGTRMCAVQKKYVVRLTDAERRRLREVIGKLKGSSQKVRRAQMLLKADVDGPAWTDRKIAEAFDGRVQTVESLRQRLVEQGFDNALNGVKRQKPPTPKLLDGKQEAQVIAMWLGAPPPGSANWSLRLLARKVVEMARL